MDNTYKMTVKPVINGSIITSPLFEEYVTTDRDHSKTIANKLGKLLYRDLRTGDESEIEITLTVKRK